MSDKSDSTGCMIAFFFLLAVLVAVALERVPALGVW